MKDQYDESNPMLEGKATIRIALLKPTPAKPTGSIISDVNFTPELDYKNLNRAKMQLHSILADVAIKAVLDFLDKAESGTTQHDINSAQ